jgi:potassium-dependent mechanosensitive channel
MIWQFTPLDKLYEFTLFKIADQAITPSWLLRLSLVVVILILVINLFQRLLKDRLLVRIGISQGNRQVISTLVSYGCGSIIFVVLLQVYGLDITSLAVVLGGLGVGIGFGLQEITKNLVSGITLLLEGKLQVGDFVEFDGLSGHIKEISIRSTIIRTLDGGDVVVPNSNLTANQVLNWSYQNFTGKLHLPVMVAYESDPIQVVETLLNSAYMQPAVLHDPPPKIHFKGFGENGLDFELWVWVNRIDEGLVIRSALNFIIEHNFRQAGIKMPFPQREVWLRHPEQQLPSPDQRQEMPPVPPPETAIAPALESKSLGNLLRQVPYFRTCSNLSLLEIIEAGYRKDLEESEIIFHEGEMGNAVYIVLSGAVASYSAKLNQCVRTYQPGDFFGEVPIMLGVPYIATTRALENSSLFVLPKKNLERLLRNLPYVGEVLSQEMINEKEIYLPIRQQLQDLGLLAIQEDVTGLADWVRTRLKKLFGS